MMKLTVIQNNKSTFSPIFFRIIFLTRYFRVIGSTNGAGKWTNPPNRKIPYVVSLVCSNPIYLVMCLYELQIYNHLDQ
jgi:hypothetical protein